MLLYLLLRLLPQWWPRSGCTLCTVHCTSVHPHSHIGSYQPRSHSLSFRLRKWFFLSILQCTLHWLQLSKRFSLRFCLEVYNFLFFLLKVGRSYHSIYCAYFCVLLSALSAQFQLLHTISSLGWHSTQRLFFVLRFLTFNPVCSLFFVCVTSCLWNIFFCLNHIFVFVFVCIVLPYSG